MTVAEPAEEAVGLQQISSPAQSLYKLLSTMPLVHLSCLRQIAPTGFPAHSAAKVKFGKETKNIIKKNNS